MVFKHVLELGLVEALGELALVLLVVDLIGLFLLVLNVTLDHSDSRINWDRRQTEEDESHVKNGPPWHFVCQAVNC